MCLTLHQQGANFLGEGSENVTPEDKTECITYVCHDGSGYIKDNVQNVNKRFNNFIHSNR
jgi:hypothetical protein